MSVNIVVKLVGTPCAECGKPARNALVYPTHTVIFHTDDRFPPCATNAAYTELRRHYRERINERGYVRSGQGTVQPYRRPDRR